ncbi:MAG: hypothetical protein P8Y69_12220 [Gammaproteobacteria bacterium]|jgi:hypothetical protein
MRKQLIALLFGLITASFAVAAPAPEADRPCRNDVMNHCGDAVGDRERMRACMQENFAKFSEQCKARIRERQAAGGQPPRPQQPSSDQ